MVMMGCTCLCKYQSCTCDKLWPSSVCVYSWRYCSFTWSWLPYAVGCKLGSYGHQARQYAVKRQSRAHGSANTALVRDEYGNKLWLQASQAMVNQTTLCYHRLPSYSFSFHSFAASMQSAKNHLEALVLARAAGSAKATAQLLAWWCQSGVTTVCCT